ncbi:DNA-processing protein DprA [Dactylosporangium sp. NPDC049525]|uniref:DNA-processing protein DprA n=1 Tax=Dactylosporangium sp. NPDC049525 TaxID=3154730 RepID=UPI00344536B4
MSTDRISWLVLAALTEPGDRALGDLVRSIGPAEALTRIVHDRQISPKLAQQAHTRLAALGRPRGQQFSGIAEDMLEHADRLGARIITPADEEWPSSLDDLAGISTAGRPALRLTAPPLCLWLRGPVRLEQALRRSVSIVGARAMTSYGQFVASEFAFGLADLGWTVVSGGALGVDVTAHRGALAAGGVTCAVLACGIEQVYPVSNSAVFERIAEEGLLMTEWPPGTRPLKAGFLSRDRLVAAATNGTVMVEAGARSGARNALGCARLLHRPAMVVPGPVTSAMSVGCHVELRQPGTVLVTRVEEIIEEIGSVGASATPIQDAGRPEDTLDTL